MVWKNFITGIYLMIIGMGLVFSALFLLMNLIKAIGWIEGFSIRRAKKKATARAQGKENVQDKLEDEITPEEIAVICAAAAEALGTKIEVHHIQMLHDENLDAWSKMGRMDIMRSHNIHSPKQ